ncbi:MAG: hypothetical protein GTO51_03610 [Candidatus Latescibacteria bacterium]|nr:hypothetical protein [Candidatus Latescibacterota bacterium]NIM20926.1 hypothetical protein [Candidatus Latescibacterota bacterium]NIM65061.1 hypothetical protein [Candidatus Latescibacterota bacterium]NIO01576.1 hypothetical protein [Candidatus Latescibacterota bacterium]NIO28093.1 hypothetical protein [Candidatus Latescibacterota bacterium]
MRYGDQLIDALRGQKELEKQTVLGFITMKEKRRFVEELLAEGVRLRVCVDDIDQYGLLLVDLDLEVTEERFAGRDAADFQYRVKRVCEEIPYLDGNFQLVEMDRKGLHAVLRTEPTKDIEKSYYELEIIDGREARLRRFTLSGDVPRRNASVAVLSTDTFRRLTDRLIEIFGPAGPIR